MEMNQFALGALSVIFIFFEVVAIIALLKSLKATKEIKEVYLRLDEMRKEMLNLHLDMAQELDRAANQYRDEIRSRIYEAENNMKEHLKFVEDSLRAEAKKPAKKTSKKPSSRTKSLYS